MTRTRPIIGLVTGALLILSGAAHSLLGWRQLRGELAAARVPPDLSFGVALGWHFGGLAMLVFGVIAVATFARRLRGERAYMFVPSVIGGAYVLFGAWALVASSYRPFFLVFIVPGVLLLAAAWGHSGDRARPGA
jgi:hypothetical protein